MDGDAETATNAQAKRPAEESLAAVVSKAAKVEGQEQQQRAPETRNGGENGSAEGGTVKTPAVVAVDKVKPRTPAKIKPKSGDKPMTCPEHPDKAFQSHSDFRFPPPFPSPILSMRFEEKRGILSES